ncbi:DUF2599 domain-containing protein [Peptoniphilus porci]|uniref:DUF2599 domain-containing protein n=1 Tax=Peptoniphilus porci TaxID=2652280 RepID=A0A1U7M1M0_9FIRM|nr:DUF2599 domain-containing protein [Peptoniphilus porci]OLR65572.1 hypothetical protein BIV18_08640 [Peptoniphilus porci]
MKKFILVLTIIAILASFINPTFAGVEKNMDAFKARGCKNFNGVNKVDFPEFSLKNIDGHLLDNSMSLSNKDFYNNELIIEEYLNSDKEKSLEYDIDFKSECKIIFPESVKEDGKLNNDGSYIIKSNNKNIGLITNLSAIDANGQNLKIVTKKIGNRIQHSFINEEEVIYPVKITVGISQVLAGNYYNYFSDGYWQHRTDGVSLSLYPRKTFYLDSTLEDAWSEVIYMHGSSPNWSNERGMYKQFKCHNMYAPNKRPWNLEPWRPNVSMSQTILAGCNP